MFELKKVMSALLMPLPALLLIGLLGLALISFTTKRKTGCFVVLFSFVGLFLVAFQPVSTKLLMPLEREHKAFYLCQVPLTTLWCWVMATWSMTKFHQHRNCRAALMRLTEGIRILRMYPGAKLILSGYDGGSEISHARMMANVALALGVAKSDIILLEDAKDTWEEARQAAAFVQQKEIVLVTSASHMSRALYEFNAAGIKPIPAPTNFLAIDEVSQPWDKYSPKARYLEQTELFWHEYLGSVWQRLRDTVGQTPMVEAE